MAQPLKSQRTEGLDSSSSTQMVKRNSHSQQESTPPPSELKQKPCVQHPQQYLRIQTEQPSGAVLRCPLSSTVDQELPQQRDECPYHSPSCPEQCCTDSSPMMKMRKRVGESTPPCGTLWLCSFFRLFYPWSWTGAFRLWRYWLIQVNMLPDTPCCRSFSLRPSFQTLSKAFSMSIQTTNVCFLYWKESSIS